MRKWKRHCVQLLQHCVQLLQLTALLCNCRTFADFSSHTHEWFWIIQSNSHGCYGLNIISAVSHSRCSLVQDIHLSHLFSNQGVPLFCTKRSGLNISHNYKPLCSHSHERIAVYEKLYFCCRFSINGLGRVTSCSCLTIPCPYTSTRISSLCYAKPFMFAWGLHVQMSVHWIMHNLFIPACNKRSTNIHLDCHDHFSGHTILTFVGTTQLQNNM